MSHVPIVRVLWFVMIKMGPNSLYVTLRAADVNSPLDTIIQNWSISVHETDGMRSCDLVRYVQRI